MKSLPRKIVDLGPIGSLVFFVFFGLQVARCSSNSLASPRLRRDPAYYRDHLVAFSADTRRVIVRREVNGDKVLLEWDIAKGVTNEITQSALNDPSYYPAKTLLADVINAPFGVIRFTGHEVEVHGHGSPDPVTLRSVGAQGRPDRWSWLSSIDDNYLAIELYYDDGPVPSSTVWIFELAAIHAKLLAAEVFAGVRR